ncbi:MAG: nucleoside triphosphate pyrophosphohydrolase [archaeon]|jgi:predicted house-cleaning noncanonical NTP pyrophosphatase (MazG superfamily)
MKLVRDKIPELIRLSGRNPITHKAHEKEFEDALINKLEEELNEIKEDRNSEEVADLIEVAYALGKVYGKSEKAINQIRKQKNIGKGAFNKKIILEK